MSFTNINLLIRFNKTPKIFCSVSLVASILLAGAAAGAVVGGVWGFGCGCWLCAGWALCGGGPAPGVRLLSVGCEFFWGVAQTGGIGGEFYFTSCKKMLSEYDRVYTLS